MGVCGGGSTQTGKMMKAFSFVFLIDFQNIVLFSNINCNVYYSLTKIGL